MEEVGSGREVVGVTCESSGLEGDIIRIGIVNDQQDEVEGSCIRRS